MERPLGPTKGTAGMADQATERTTIAAPLERVVAVAEDVERYPEWARDVKSVEILDRDDQQRPLRVAFRAGTMGPSAQYVRRSSCDDGPTRIAWVVGAGGVVRRLDGEYGFGPVDGDAGATSVTY